MSKQIELCMQYTLAEWKEAELALAHGILALNNKEERFHKKILMELRRHIQEYVLADKSNELVDG
jgi:hypothetical protein